jgi:hypothetical protein
MKKITIFLLVNLLFSFSFGQTTSGSRSISGPTSVSACDGDTTTYFYTVSTLPGDTAFLWFSTDLFINCKPPESNPSTVPQMRLNFIGTSADTGSLGVLFYPDLRKEFLHNIKVVSNLASTPTQPIGRKMFCKSGTSALEKFYVDYDSAYTSYIWEIVPKNHQIVGPANQDVIWLKFDLTDMDDGYIRAKGVNDCGEGDYGDTLKITFNSNTSMSVTLSGQTSFCNSTASAKFTATPNNNIGGQRYCEWLVNDSIWLQAPPPFDFTPSRQLNNGDTITCKYFCDTLQYRCPDNYPAIDTVIISVFDSTKAGYLSTDKDIICRMNKTDSITLVGSNGDVFIWQSANEVDSANWSKIVFDPALGSNPTRIPLNTGIIGSFKYKVITKSGVCPEKTTTSKNVKVVGFDTLMIVEKDSNNQTGRDKDSIIFICTSCVNDPNIGKYEWAYIDPGPPLVTYPAPAAYDSLPYCIFKRMPSDYSYFLRIIGTGDNACSDTITFKAKQHLKNSDFKLGVYPNPNNGLFTIELDGNVYGTTTIRIIDMVGQEHQRFSTEKEDQVMRMPIDVDNLTQGVYMVEAVFPGGERLIKKIFIY